MEMMEGMKYGIVNMENGNLYICEAGTWVFYDFMYVVLRINLASCII